MGNGPLTLAGGTFQPPLPVTQGLSAQYYTTPTNNYITSASLSNFNTTYLTGAGMTLALTNNLTANVYNGASGNFTFDLNPTSGVAAEGASFPTGPAPAGINTTNNFAAKYSGYFYAAASGSYTFSTNSDDSSMLWITAGQSTPDTAVVQYGGAHGEGAGTPTITPVTLTAGTYYPITVGYDQGGGQYGLQVSYTPPGGSSTLIPVSLLYSGLPTNTYSNALTVTQSSTINLPNSLGATYQFPSLAIGNAALNLTGGTTGSSVTISGATTISGSAALNISGSNAPLTLAGGLSGTGSFTKSGSGTLYLTADGSSFSGAATVTGGAIQVSNSTALAGSTVTISTADGLTFNGITAATIGGLAGNSNGVLQNLSAAGVALTAGGNGQNTTYSGVLGGSGSLIKTGSGTLTLTNTNNFSGALTVNNGTLEVVAKLSTANGTGPITLGGSGPATLRFIGSHDETSRPINLGNNATIDASGSSTSDSLTLDGTIAGNGYNLTLTGTSTQGGELSPGVLILGAGSLTKNGPGVWTLDGSNTCAGTTLNAGMLVVAGSGATGSGPVVLNGGILASVPGSVTLGGSILAGSGSNYLTPGGDGGIGTLAVGGLALNKFSTMRFDISSTSSLDRINDSGALVFSGTGAAELLVPGGLTPGNTYRLISFSSDSGLTTGDFSLLPINGSVAGYSLALANTGSAGELDLVVGSAVSFSGSAAWTSSGGSLWSNGNNWSDGNGLHGVPGLTGSTAHDVATLSNSSAVAMINLTGEDPNLRTLNLNLSLSGSGYTLTGGSLTFDAGPTGTAAVIVGSGTHSIASVITLASSTSIAPAAGAQLTLAGNISDGANGPRPLVLADAGTLILSGTDNTYSGGTIVGAGELIANNSGAIQDGSSLVVGAGGMFIFDPTATGTPVAATCSNGPSQISPVPEPGTIALLLAALASAAIYRRFRRKHKGT